MKNNLPQNDKDLENFLEDFGIDEKDLKEEFDLNLDIKDIENKINQNSNEVFSIIGKAQNLYNKNLEKKFLEESPFKFKESTNQNTSNKNVKTTNLNSAQNSKETKKESCKISKETCNVSSKNIIKNRPKRASAESFMDKLPDMLGIKRKNNSANNQKAKKIKR